MNKRKLLTLVVGGITVLVLSILLIQHFFRFPFRSITPFEAVPHTTAIFWQTLDWEDKSDLYLKEISFDEKVPSFIQETKLFLQEVAPSFSKESVTYFVGNLLFQDVKRPMGLVLDATKLAKDLQELNTNQIKQFQFKNNLVYEVYEEGNYRFSYAIFRNLVLFANKTILIEESLNQLNQRSTNLYQKHSFTKLVQPPTKNQSHWYVQFEYLADVFPVLKNNDFHGMLNDLAMLRLSYHKDQNQLPLKGELYFDNAKKGTILSTNLLPKDTLFQSLAGIPEQTVFLQTKEIVPTAQLEDDYQQYIFPWISKMAIIGAIEPETLPLSSTKFSCFGIKNKQETLSSLSEFFKTQKANVQPLDYNGFTIYKVNQMEQKSIKFPVFNQSFDQAHFMFLNGQLILTNSKACLQKWIDQYIVSQSFINKIDVQKAWVDLSNKVENVIYIDWAYWGEKIFSEFSSSLGSSLFKYKMKSSSCTFEGNYIAREEKAVDPSILWRLELDATARSNPSVVSYQEDNAILIQDILHQLYLINNQGKLIWKQQMNLPIQSAIYPIQFYDNEENYWVFNTKTHIHCMDERGENRIGFPIKLKSKATNAVLAVDFEQNNHFHFFLAGEDHQIYGYDEKARPLPQWHPKNCDTLIHAPLQHFQRDTNDFLMSLDVMGEFHVYQRNGVERFQYVFDSSLVEQQIYYDNSALIQRMVIPQKNGKVRVFNTEGANFQLLVGEEGMQFLYADVVGDARKDYISLSDRNLAIYTYEDQNFGLSNRYSYPYPQDTIFIVQDAGKQRIGSLDRSKKQIHLVNANGRLHPDFPLAGTTTFATIPSTEKEQESIVVAYENQVVAYRVSSIFPH